MRHESDFDHFTGGRLATAFVSPIERALEVPWWGKVGAIAAATTQYVVTDMFGGALILVFAAMTVDYGVGVTAAKRLGKYEPRLAQQGAMGKITGLLLLILLRLFEAYAHAQGVIDTRGGLATAVAIGLFTVDLQSIAHHRESFGAAPIPVLSKIFEWLQAFAGSKVPPAPQLSELEMPPPASAADEEDRP